MKKTVLIIGLIFFSSSFISAQNYYTVGVEGGTKLQTGNLKDVWGPATGGSILGTYNLSNLIGLSTELQLVLKAGYFNAKESDKFNDAYGALVKTTVSVVWPLKLYPITIGAKYFFCSCTGMKPYVTASIGTTLMKLNLVTVTSATGTVFNNGNDVVIGGLSYDIGAGVQFNISQSFYLDLNAAYDGISKNIRVPTYTNTSQLQLIEINIGVGIRL
jgi:opacity protein-like surface antigen